MTLSADGGGGVLSAANGHVQVNNLKFGGNVNDNGNSTYINLEGATRSPFMKFRDDINFRMFQSNDNGGNTLYGFGIAKGTNFTGSGVVYCGFINNNSNCKWGFRTHRPEAAVHVAASMKANQYQKRKKC